MTSRPRRSRYSPAGRHGGKWLHPATRWAVYLRDGFRCLYCFEPGTTIDHVRPVHKGGSNHPSNLVTACRSCNSAKRNLTLRQWIPEAAGIVGRRCRKHGRRKLDRAEGARLRAYGLESVLVLNRRACYGEWL